MVCSHRHCQRADGLARSLRLSEEAAPSRPLSGRGLQRGGMQRLQCRNIPGVLRLIQSIPSPRAEPFKRWLAKVGYEHLQEIVDPALALAGPQRKVDHPAHDRVLPACHRGTACRSVAGQLPRLLAAQTEPHPYQQRRVHQSSPGGCSKNYGFK